MEEKKTTRATKDQQAPATDPGNTQIKHFGRPKGSKDKQQRKIRQDNIKAVAPDPDKQLIMQHNMELWRLGRISNKDNLNEITARIETFFTICEKNSILPTVAGLALALGIDRGTLWDWVSNTRGTIKNREVVDTLKGVYSMLNAQYEEMLTQGKMIPVSAFFLMQNNHGYKQQTDHVITAETNTAPGLSDITNRAGLLSD